MKAEWQKLKDRIAESKYMVFFGGAGVSTESGVPDFRGKMDYISRKERYR